MMLNRWLLVGEWRSHIGQALVTLLAIAIGVAMGFSIHLLNSAVQWLSGARLGVAFDFGPSSG